MFYICKSCGEKIDTCNETLWMHLKLDHPDIFRNFIDFDSDTMIKDCYESGE